MAPDPKQEAHGAVLAAIKTKADEINAPSTKMAAGMAASALKDLAEALAWLEMPGVPH